MYMWGILSDKKRETGREDFLGYKNCYEFIESRCVPRTRVNIDQVLEEDYGLSEYDPIEMMKINRSANMEDLMWVRFDESETFEQIHPRARINYGG